MDVSGNREMRDHMLALLLSGQKGTRSSGRAPASPPSTRRPEWTPGAHLSEREGAEPAVGHMSPVTPERLPTDLDVRLTELTAELVAASDKDRRQIDTIRRLGLKLERSERQVRELQEQQGGASPSPARAHAPATPRRKRNDEVDELRRERKEASRRERAARKEARAAAEMLDDIRRHARRVLAERDGHLLTIAQLSEQNEDLRAQLDDPRASAMRPEAPRRPSVPPAPAFSETSLSAVPTPLQRRASVGGEGVDGNARPASSMRVREAALDEAAEHNTRSYTGRNVGSTQSAVFTRTVGSATRHSRGNSMPALGAAQSPAAGATAESDSERDVTETRGALHADMQEVLDENRALKGEIDRLKESRAARDAQLAALPDVDDELRVLETVVDVMELDLSGDRAREMQATITSIGMTPTAGAGAAAGSLHPLPTAVSDIVRRVGAVRQVIADKYGQFLEDCFTPTEESLSMPPGNTLQPYPDDTVVSLPAAVPHHPHTPALQPNAAVNEALGYENGPQGDESLGDGYAPQGDESLGDGYAPQGDESQTDGYAPQEDEALGSGYSPGGGAGGAGVDAGQLE